VRAHLEAFPFKAETQRGLLDAVQDRGVERLVGNAQIHQAVDVAALRHQREPDLTGNPSRLLLFVDGIVKDDDVAILVDDLVAGDEVFPRLALLRPARLRPQNVDGCEPAL